MVDPTKPKLEPPGTKRLKLEQDGLLSNFGFKFNLRRYHKDISEHWESFDTPINALAELFSQLLPMLGTGTHRHSSSHHSTLINPCILSQVPPCDVASGGLTLRGCSMVGPAVGRRDGDGAARQQQLAGPGALNPKP